MQSANKLYSEGKHDDAIQALYDVTADMGEMKRWYGGTRAQQRKNKYKIDLTNKVQSYVGKIIDMIDKR